MTCGKIFGFCAATFQPSGVPLGGGVVGQAAVADPLDVAGLGDCVWCAPGGALHATTRMRTPRIADKDRRVTREA
jgi:hypothetical protein